MRNIFRRLASWLGISRANYKEKYIDIEAGYKPQICSAPGPLGHFFEFGFEKHKDYTEDPAVRLRLSSDGKVRIYGHPGEDEMPSSEGTSEPYILCLDDPLPAYVSYIMGHDWRSRLQKGPPSGNSQFDGGEVIFKPSPSSAMPTSEPAEAAHRAIMRCCGAKILRYEDNILRPETPKTREILFGWPSKGGLYVLRSPDNDLNSTEDTDIRCERSFDLLEELHEYNLVFDDAKQQETMDGLCRVLQKAGAEFYWNASSCPEMALLFPQFSKRGMFHCVDDDISQSDLRCRGSRIPHPRVRLKMDSDGYVDIFGFSAEDEIPKSFPCPSLQCGSGDCVWYLRSWLIPPAYVKYIMGDDWRSQLRNAAGNDCKLIWSPCPRDAAQEAAHCLRMRRCGAFIIRDLSCIDHDRPKPLFGWPAGGGVWILREPPFNVSCSPGGSWIGLDEWYRAEDDYSAAFTKMMEQEDMEEVCRVIQEAGGEFYSDEGDCPEVVKFELLDTSWLVI